MDLRDRVVAACDSGAWTREEVAEEFGVSTSWIRRLLQRRRETGEYRPKQGERGRKPVYSGQALERLDRLVEEQPDATLHELRDRTGAACSLVTMFQHPQAFGVSSQKKTPRAAEEDRPEVKRKRRAGVKKARRVDPSRFVFVGESGVKTNMTRLRGRCKGGEHLLDSAPHGHWETTTMIAALRLDGATAPMVIEGAADAAVFRAYVKHVLAPTLQEGISWW